MAPLRSSTLPLMAHPQAPRDLIRAHIARSPLSPPHSATPISPPPSVASTSPHSVTPISIPHSESPISPHSVTPISPPKSKTPLSPLSTVTPISPPLSVYSDSSITPSSPEEGLPLIANVLARSETMSSTSTMEDSLPDTDHYIAPISTPTPRSKRRWPKVSTVSVFSGASGITITGGSITTSGGSIIQGKVVPEIEYPEYSEDEETEVSSFKDVVGMTCTGTLRIVTAGGDVISGVGGASLPKRRGRNINVHTFTGARDIQLGTVEMLNASEDVVLE